MRVNEVARDFKVSPEQLLQLLRELGVPTRSVASSVDDATVARLRARIERERRAGHGEADEIIGAVIEDAHTSTRRRRRRVKSEDEPEVVEEDSTASPVADAAEAMAAEAAEKAADRGAELVTSGGAEPTGVTVVVDPPLTTQPEAEAATAVEPEPAAEAQPAAPAAPPTELVEQPRPPAGRRPMRVADLPLSARTTMPPRAPARPAQPQQRGAPPAPAASAGPSGNVRIQAQGFTSDGQRKKDKRKKKQRRVDQDAVQQNVSRVMAEIRGGGKKRRTYGRDDREERMEREAERDRQAAEESVIVRVNEFLTVSELAELIDHSATEIISSAFKNLGLMVTINQRLDFDQIELLLDEFGFRAVRETEYGGDLVEEEQAEDRPEDLAPRPPVVTVMGHVDHGKTSLLDHIRKTNVIAGEAGGITQHIGAYHVLLPNERSLTFLDTPGHAAFTAMRARGAEVTDVVILVVAADDSVMPQTVEAISHARNAGVPLIVAINKVDLAGANPAKVKQELLNHGVVVEEFGGEVMSAEVSAKAGTGIDALLEKVLLQADLLELKANANREAGGVVVEAQLDVGKGPVATVLVMNGTLKVGDDFVCGMYSGRVRALFDERGHTVPNAGPGIPVQVLGFAGVPQAGDHLVVMDSERAGEIAQTRQRLDREKQLRVRGRGVRLIDISRMLAEGRIAKLNLVIKGDVDGSVQALSDSLEQLSTPEVNVEVIHRAVGAINESDVLLAATSGAIIIGFHVRPDANARNTAEREGVDIRLYSIIYEAVADMRSAMEGMLAPEEREMLLGAAEVRQIFKVPRVGTVAGCMVTEGTLDRKARVRVVRDGVQVYDGELASLKRFKDDVREVREGFECGLNVSGFNDVKVGDVLECYRVEEFARTLASTAEGGDNR